MEVAAQPVQELFMLLMLRITDSLQQIVEPRYAAAVFWRSVPFTRQAGRVRAPWFRRQAFLDRDSMLPAVTKVIGVHGLGSGSVQHIEQSCGSFAGGARSTKGPLHRIGCSVPLLTDTELMHRAVFPTHGDLQDIVQLLQRQVRGNQQATPDRWVRAEQSDLDLVDLLRLLGGVRCWRCQALFDVKMRRTDVRPTSRRRAIADLLTPAPCSFRAAYSRMARFCIARVCRSWLETRAYRPARNIFAGLRPWPKTCSVFAFRGARFPGISGCHHIMRLPVWRAEP